MPASNRTSSAGERGRHPNGGPARRRLGSERGFTLIEVLLGAVILIIGLGALFGLLDASVKATYNTRAREGATNLARQMLEDARTIPYAEMSPTAIEGELQAMQGLADSSGVAGWQVVRRGITYTVTAKECSIDDPKDGLGTHDSTFCKDPGEEESIAAEPPDTQPADLKRVTASVQWTIGKRTSTVTQVETLTAAGEAVGLSASNLQLSTPVVAAPSAPVIIKEPESKTLVFTFTAPTGTTATSWSLDGGRQTPAPTKSGASTWTFSWTIAGLSDGAYKVAVQAINATGVIGPPFSITVTLIRNVPAAPASVVGSFNTINVGGTPKKVVELQWTPNAERNVVGYRVYAPSGKLVCPEPENLAALSLAVTCIDFNPPSPTAANLTYKVVALFYNHEGEVLSEKVSEGTASTFTVAGGEPPPSGPNAPGAPLNLVHNADGSVTLTWSAPSGGTPVSFYRIYRGSTDYTSRFDVTGSGSTTTYTDAKATVEHSYWVTAVSANLTESAFLGPVKG